jgi:hypothetical protein
MNLTKVKLLYNTESQHQYDFGKKELLIQVKNGKYLGFEEKK